MSGLCGSSWSTKDTCAKENLFVPMQSMNKIKEVRETLYAPLFREGICMSTNTHIWKFLIWKVGNVPRWNSSSHSWYGSQISMAMTCSLRSSPLLLFSLIIAEVALEHLYLKRLQPSQIASYLQMVGFFPRRLSKDSKHLAISQQTDSTQVHVPIATHRVTL